MIIHIMNLINYKKIKRKNMNKLIIKNIFNKINMINQKIKLNIKNTIIYLKIQKINLFNNLLEQGKDMILLKLQIKKYNKYIILMFSANNLLKKNNRNNLNQKTKI